MKRIFFTAMLGAWFAPGVFAAPVFVDGAWLAQRLADPKVVIVDMSDDDNQYLRFHLPGAMRLPYDVLVKERKNDKVKGRLDDAELARVLGRLGVTRDSQVVIYDDLGGLNAARLFWELERIGHREASVLDGGLVQWILDGRKVVSTPVKRVPATYEIKGAMRDNEASLQAVRRAAEQRTALLLDARSDEEYAGAPQQPRTGHIPGARSWPWDLGVDFDRGFVRRDDATLKKSLAQVGADPNLPVIAYDRSGHRAARVYLTLRSLGYEQVKVYPGSVNEYTAPLKPGKAP